MAILKKPLWLNKISRQTPTGDSTTPSQKEAPKRYQNTTTSVRPTPAPVERDMWLVNLESPDFDSRIRIQAVPDTLNVDPNTQWSSIQSMGRNNPFLQYTGGSDTLSFQLDWYSQTSNRADVIKACRFVEALARNDGESPPPKVLLIWGDVFTNAVWIVSAAPYKLMNFESGNGMRPTQAYQELTLKRVMDLGVNDASFSNEPEIVPDIDFDVNQNVTNPNSQLA